MPPSDLVLGDMEAAIVSGSPGAAALMAMDNSAFYNVTLKNFATPWTNREQTMFAPLNDYTTTVIGMVRDNVPFNELLSANLVDFSVILGASNTLYKRSLLIPATPQSS